MLSNSTRIFYPQLRSYTALMSSIPNPAGEAPKWFDSLPKPKSEPRQMRVEDYHSIASSEKVLVVDVRRADIEVGFFTGGRLLEC